jgi:hypothetical protein
VITTLKLAQSAPPAPTLANKTADSVTLNTITGAEYSNDGSVWQTSETFSGLTPGTQYSFYARMKEDTTYGASPASPALNVRTYSDAEMLAEGIKLLYPDLNITSDGYIVTVDGNVNSSGPINLEIKLDLTVKWNAGYSSNATGALIKVTGGGTLEIGDGASIVNNADGAKAIESDGDVLVNGGTISANGDGIAIHADGNVIVNGGTVLADGDDGIAISANGNVDVNGGVISANGAGGTAISAGGIVSVDGGAVSANGASGLAIDAVGDVNQNGGIITASDTTGTAIATTSGTVRFISGVQIGGDNGIAKGNVTLNADIEIPSNVTLTFWPESSVSNRGVITNLGVIRMNGGAINNLGTVVNESEIDNGGGEFVNRGTLTNNYDFRNAGGWLQNYGTIDGSSPIDNDGGVIENFGGTFSLTPTGDAVLERDVPASPEEPPSEGGGGDDGDGGGDSGGGGCDTGTGIFWLFAAVFASLGWKRRGKA